MVGRPFVCTKCGRSVSVLSYRASCPDCGGPLEHRRETAH